MRGDDNLDRRAVAQLELDEFPPFLFLLLAILQYAMCCNALHKMFFSINSIFIGCFYCRGWWANMAIF